MTNQQSLNRDQAEKHLEKQESQLRIELAQKLETIQFEKLLLELIGYLPAQVCKPFKDEKYHVRFDGLPGEARMKVISNLMLRFHPVNDVLTFATGDPIKTASPYRITVSGRNGEVTNHSIEYRMEFKELQVSFKYENYYWSEGVTAKNELDRWIHVFERVPLKRHSLSEDEYLKAKGRNRNASRDYEIPAGPGNLPLIIYSGGYNVSYAVTPEDVELIRSLVMGTAVREGVING